MIQRFHKVNKIKGELRLPGDKSISHRAVMFASMAEGKSLIKNCSNSADVNSTIECFGKLGVDIEKKDELLVVNGVGLKKFKEPTTELYAGNSGTTARLMTGILTAQNFKSVITGDNSLSKRPMKRIIEPLQEMGAIIEASEAGTLPITISPTDNLHAIEYEMSVPSAQVKSAIILSALHLNDKTVIYEPVPTRNHTEIMLGLETEYDGTKKKIYASIKNYPTPFEMTVPSDISTAAFFIVLSLLIPDSELVIRNVSLNETRTGILSVLKMMGANILIENESLERGEKKGDIRILSSELVNTEISKEIIPNIIDEIPILSVAGIFAEGNFRINHAKELRYKESDRIAALCNNYKKLGLYVEEFEDGFEVGGSIKNKDVIFESYGDHRIAMALAVLSMNIKEGGSINEFESVAISNPDFLKQLNEIAK
ncbi:3-phosphoshikimate 1-carboxyvinyltransferase [Melioribacter sp. OK-6-Me]|uniref:3-phosphoshikimate 1-carboxyvinyltransferase n=1 Tax=unclassified Melioribacter TaxID=2627329 RepID=UPI003EDB3AEA